MKKAIMCSCIYFSLRHSVVLLWQQLAKCWGARNWQLQFCEFCKRFGRSHLKCLFDVYVVHSIYDTESLNYLKNNVLSLILVLGFYKRCWEQKLISNTNVENKLQLQQI